MDSESFSEVPGTAARMRRRRRGISPADELESCREELEFQAAKLLRRVTQLEEAARRAQPEERTFFSWPAFGLNTGLTIEQEAFISQWSPNEVLAQSQAQRAMVSEVRSWVRRHDGWADVTAALDLISNFSDHAAPLPLDDSKLTRAVPPAAEAARSWQVNESGTSVAMLDRSGVIVAVNEVWSAFCQANGGQIELCGPGASYLDACDAGGDDLSRAVAQAINEAIHGEALRAATIVLPCHSPTEQRWYELVIAPWLSPEAHAICGATLILTPTTAPNDQRDPATTAGRSNLAADLGREVTLEIYDSTVSLCSVLNRINDPLALSRIESGIRALDHALARLRAIAVELN